MLIRVRTAVGVLALLAPGLAGCGLTGDHELAVGDSARVLDEPTVTQLSESATLTAQLPVGELRLGWSVDGDLLGSVVDEDDRSFAAADGAELLALAWDVDATASPPDGTAGLATVGTAPYELALLSDGERTILASEGDRAIEGAAVAAVPAAGDVALEITFDGVTQVVGPAPDERDVPDEARPLYTEFPTATGSIACEPSAAEAFCRAEATWLPWVASQGWAPAGELWPVVRLTGRVPDATEPPVVTATLSGADPADSLPVAPGADAFDELVVYPAAVPEPARLDLVVTVAGDRISGTTTLRPAPTDR